MLALASVENPDLEYFERKVRRSYSVTFHVSLLDADSLPIEQILQHLYEYQYETMSQKDRIEEAQELLKTPEQREVEHDAELRRLDEDEAYLLRDQQEEAAKNQKAPAPKVPKPDIVPPLPEIPDRHITFGD